MNVNTGELVSAEQMLAMKEEFVKTFAPVPEKLRKEAEKELGGRATAFVDMTKNTPLVRWAKKKRRKNIWKSRLRMVKASRRRNREGT